MKILYFMGRNPENRSGVSWKIWKIARYGRVVEVRWGPATLRNRRPVMVGVGTTRRWSFTSEAMAIKSEAARLREKLQKGYQRRSRWR